MDNKPRVLPGVVGVTLNLAWAAVLFGICATDGGHWREDWLSCIFWCSTIVLPALLAITGLVKERRSFLIAAASLCAPLALISLAGAGLPMIIPGILYGVAAGNTDPSPTGDRTLGAGYFALAGLLILLGFIGMFSIGAPFFLFGILMLALAPVVKNRSPLLPATVAVLGAGMVIFFIFVLQKESSTNCVRARAVGSDQISRQVERSTGSRSC